MKLLNLRLGFATNSSSSHSVLVFPNHRQSDDWNSNDFGWDTFTLATEDLKLSYLMGQLAENFEFGFDHDHDEDIIAVLYKIFGDDATELLSKQDPELKYSVDHQSRWSWPRVYGNPDLTNASFIHDVAEWIKREDVLVLGGNDNGGEHPLIGFFEDEDGNYETTLPEGSTQVNLANYEISSYSVARKDSFGNWCIFNTKSGAKLRLWFGEDDAPKYSATPELVDIKITDFCPFDCHFCYQDSGQNGKHATLENIEYIVDELAKAEVFEVAIGGGEPTLHPHFLQILKEFTNRGIVANFTTRNLTWLKNGPGVKQIIENSGTFAYSVQSASEIPKFAKYVNDYWNTKREGYNFKEKKPNIHIVMGTVSREEFAEMLKLAREHSIRPTLLGWKRVGRGNKDPEFPYMSWWFEEVSKAEIYQMGIDTALAAESKEIFENNNIPEWLYHIEDGIHSAYIDAVNMTMHSSSWEPKKKKWTFGKQWRKGWIRYNESRNN